MTYNQFTPYMFLFATFLIHRARKNGKISFLFNLKSKIGLLASTLNYIPLFCSSVVLASKFYDDVHYNNKEYSKLLNVLFLDPNPIIHQNLNCKSSIELQQKFLHILNENEKILLKSIDYRVFVTKETLENWIFSFTENL